MERASHHRTNPAHAGMQNDTLILPYKTADIQGGYFALLWDDLGLKQAKTPPVNTPYKTMSDHMDAKFFHMKMTV